MHSGAKKNFREVLKYRLFPWLISKLNAVSKRFFTVHVRPFYAEQHAKPTVTIGSHPKTAIVLQGPLIAKERFTLESVRLYRRLFPAETLILSTWEGEDPAILAEVEKADAAIVLSRKPSVAGPSNVNYQIVSTRAGVAKAAELGARSVLKTRTDARIHAAGAIQFLHDLQKAFPLTGRTGQRQRFVGIGMGTVRNSPYHLSDMLLFGDLEDMRSYWQSPLVGPEAKQGALVPERHLLTSFLRRCGEPVEETLYLTWKAYAERCVIADTSALDHFWYKYGHYREHRKLNYAINDDRLGFAEWLALHVAFRDGRIQELEEAARAMPVRP